MQTISEAFKTWRDTNARIPAADPHTRARLIDELAAIEDTAVLLPITAVQDVWQLLTMTIDETNQPNVAAITLFERARRQAIGGTV